MPGRAGGRSACQRARNSASYSMANTLRFDVFPATRLTSVVLIGTGAHTHWVEAGVPRRLELTVRQTGQSAAVQLPTDVNRLPVGHYLLFGMVDDIPSIAEIVRVRG